MDRIFSSLQGRGENILSILISCYLFFLDRFLNQVWYMLMESTYFSDMSKISQKIDISLFCQNFHECVVDVVDIATGFKAS